MEKQKLDACDGMWPNSVVLLRKGYTIKWSETDTPAMAFKKAFKKLFIK